MAEKEWPVVPFKVESISGVDRLPRLNDLADDAKNTAMSSMVEHGITYDKDDPESIGEAVFSFLVRGESSARNIAKSLDLPVIRVRALIAQAKRRFVDAAVEVHSNPEARRMALSARAEEIGRLAMSEALVTAGNERHKFLALALRSVVEQSKLEGLDTQKVEVTEHKIDEKRETTVVHKRLEDQLSRFGVSPEQALALSRNVTTVVSKNIEAGLKSQEDVVEAEVVSNTQEPQSE